MQCIFAIQWHIRNLALICLDARGILCACVFMCMCVIIFPYLLLRHYSLCISLPEGISAKREVIERTEVCEYVQSLTSGFIMPNFQVGISLFLFFTSYLMRKHYTQNKWLYVSQKFKFLYACMLSESGLSDQALDYCETIARTVATFPDRITDTLLDELIHVNKMIHICEMIPRF